MSRRPAPPDRFDRRLLPPMMIGAVLNPVNTAIIAVALTPIGIALGSPVNETVWLVSSLYLATAIGQPLVGRLVDLHGVRTLFLSGAVLVTIAGLIGTLAPESRESIWWLVAARVILGLGTCAGFPAAMHLIKTEAARTGKASPAVILTLLSVTTQTTAVIAPALGGFLVGGWGWRATFAINVPLGIITFVLGALYFPRNSELRRVTGEASEGGPGDGEPDAGSTKNLDAPGIALFAVSMLSLLIFLQNLSFSLLWLVAIAATAGVAFVWREKRTTDPFIDIDAIGSSVPLLLTYLRSLLTAVISYTFMYGFTQWLEDGRGLAPSVAGLILLPTFAVGVAVALAVGRRPEVSWKLLAGSAAQIVASVFVLFMTATSPLWFLCLAMLVLGIPQGLNSLAIQNSVYFQADPDRIASSAGLQRTFFYLGAIVSAVIYSNVFGARATTDGLHTLAWVLIGIAVVFLLITVFDRSLARIGREDSSGEDQNGENPSDAH